MVCLLVNNLLDVEGPLKRFTEFVIDPNFSDHSYTENDFRTRADSVAVSAEQIAQSARMVAVGNLDGNRMLAESLIISADRLESLAPQLISAGHIRLVYPGNEAADDHFENLRSQYTQCIMRIRGTCDAAINTVNFISQSAEAIMAQIEVCESGLKSGEKVSLMTESVGRMIRLSQRVVQLLKQEAENSEDGQFVHQINRSNENLEACISTLISISRNIVENMKDPCNILVWRQKTNSLLEAVREVHEAVASPFCVSSRGNENSTVHKRIGRYLSPPEINSFPDLSSIQLDDKQDTSYGGSIPPRPPLPPADLYADPTPQIAAISSSQCDTTDDEADDIFLNVPIPSQGPIMTAARDLHQEVTQWSSKDNDIIVAAKRMALLMAKLSKLVSQDMRSSQRDLIACAKEIAKSSSDVTRIATDLAKECSDKRIRMNLLQVCERIPTIATQLKILSTVKATMLGCQGSKEDQEATDMIVGNAQNLMQSVKLTVTASESASIKIRTAAGVKLVWVRKHPWYIY